MTAVQISEYWKPLLQNEFNKPYFIELINFLKTEKQQNKIIYPTGKLIFNAFNLLKPNDIKVVILGQDPYHNPNQAMGLSFSVPKGIKPPPSLINIYKELKNDIGVVNNLNNGDLTPWCTQGVFLLNAALTVRQNEPNSHAKIGWHNFTDQVIKIVSEQLNNIVFILWGNFAQQKTEFIDAAKHLIISSAHPSPFSADKGFFGSKPFSKTNEYLISRGKQPIDWKIE